MKLSAVSLALLTLLAGRVAMAGPYVFDREEAAQSRRQKHDDKQDHWELTRIVRTWDLAVERGDRWKERRADRELEYWLREELREERFEDRQSRREKRRSERKYRYDRRGRSYERRRDALDDARDHHREKRETRETYRIADKLSMLQPRFNRGRASSWDYRQKRKLLHQLERLEAREVRASRREFREDRRGRDRFMDGRRRAQGPRKSYPDYRVYDRRAPDYRDEYDRNPRRRPRRPSREFL